jgi:hypothetical protein
MRDGDNLNDQSPEIKKIAPEHWMTTWSMGCSDTTERSNKTPSPGSLGVNIPLKRHALLP